jgi:hypothetical protein
MSLRGFAAARLPLAALLIAAAATAQPSAARFEGTWDLIWQTRRGPQQRGYLVLTRSGAALSGEIHGRGNVRATGSTSGSSFVLRGSRMSTPYRIEGRVTGDRMEGALKVLSVDRRFTGLRRPSR